MSHLHKVTFAPYDHSLSFPLTMSFQKRKITQKCEVTEHLIYVDYHLVQGSLPNLLNYESFLVAQEQNLRIMIFTDFYF